MKNEILKMLRYFYLLFVIVFGLIAIVGSNGGGGSDDNTTTTTNGGSNTDPTATITSPSDGSTFNDEDTITFSGSGNDTEDGTLTGSSLVWTSDIDGEIGTGDSSNKICTQDEYGGQCVTYVRNYFGGSYQLMPGLCQYSDDCGAYNSWGHWDLGFGSGPNPAANSIMVIDQTTGLPTGHVGVVIDVSSNLDGTNSLTIQESNWNLDELVDCGVTYTFYSGDSELTREGGTTRYPVLGFIYGPSASFTRNDLSVGTHTITLTATDSEGATGSDSISITVNQYGNASPTATITTPLDGASFAEGDDIAFTGTGTDLENGELTESYLVWTSSLDGQIGTGTSYTISDLSVGTHTITLTATDSDGATGSNSVSITVNAIGNTLPTATITSPLNGSTFTEGDTITFTGSGSDTEDGALAGNSLTWTSNIDGQIGTGASFTSNDLSAGDHTITLTSTDSDGATGSDSVSITVSGTGSIAVTWLINCQAAGISTVEGTVYDSSDNTVASGGPWDCAAHSGTIENVPEGSNRKVVVLGKDSSGEIIYQGGQTGIDVIAGQTTNAGTIIFEPV